MRTFVTFESTLPDDTVYGPDGSPDEPGGRNIAEAIAEALRAGGYEVTDGPYNHESFGWGFEVSVGGVTIWCLLQYPQPWLLITKQQRRFLDWLARRRFDAEHGKFLTVLERVLSSNSAFSSLTWYTRGEYESSEGRKN